MKKLRIMGMLLAFPFFLSTGDSMENPFKRKGWQSGEREEEKKEGFMPCNHFRNKKRECVYASLPTQVKSSIKKVTFMKELTQDSFLNITNIPNLKDLSLIAYKKSDEKEERDYKIQRGISPEILNSLASSVRSVSHLTSLKIVRHSLFAEGIKSISLLMQEAHSKKNPLTRLKLKEVFMEKEGFKIICQSLSYLTHLSLSHNTLGNEDVKKLVLYAFSNSSLISIALNGNTITDEGAISLAGFLCHNSTLRKLNLKKNRIGAQGALYLSVALTRQDKKKGGLEKLKLGKNPLGDEGVSSMLPYLSKAFCLRRINLENIGMTDEGAYHVLEATHHQDLIHLTKINVSDNDDLTYSSEELYNFNKLGRNPRFFLGD